MSKKPFKIEEFTEYMKKVKAEEIISTMKSNPLVLRDVLVWIVKNEHDKKFKKCKLNMADDCEGFGLASQFHGRRCIACSREYNRSLYTRNNPVVIKSRRNGLKPCKDRPSKRSDSDDESSESECEKPKKRKRISFKKGTKL